MIQIERVQAGDTMVWLGKCGEIQGKVKAVADGSLCVFTDERHNFPIELLCGCPATRLIQGEGKRETLHTETWAAPAQTFKSISDAPVLF